MNTLRNFIRDERGQDLVEYTLLLAFVALASAGIFMAAGGSIKNIWNNAQTRLTEAESKL